MPELTISRDGARIVIAGEIRTVVDRELLRAAVAEAVEQLEPTDAPEIVVDVAGAGYLDTYSLVSLVATARRCVDVGLTLALEGCNEEQLEQLRVTKIDQVLAVHGARVAAARPS